MVRSTRDSEYIQVGLSTRASIALLRLSKAYAFLANRQYCVPEDVVRAFFDISEHRIVLSTKARMNNLSVKRVLESLRTKVEVPILS